MNFKKQFLIIAAGAMFLGTMPGAEAMNRRPDPDRDGKNRWRCVGLGIYLVGAYMVPHSIVTAPPLILMGRYSLSTKIFLIGVLALSNAVLCYALKVPTLATYYDTPSSSDNVRPLIRIAKKSLQRAYNINSTNADTVDTPDATGTTRLTTAARQEDTTLLNTSIAHGATIEKRSNGNTPLMDACKECSLESIKTLLIAGADRNAANEFGRTPLNYIDNYIADAKSRYAAIMDPAAIAARQLLNERDELRSAEEFLLKVNGWLAQAEEAREWLTTPVQTMVSKPENAEFNKKYHRRFLRWSRATRSLPLALALYENFNDDKGLRHYFTTYGYTKAHMHIVDSGNLPTEIAHYLMSFVDQRSILEHRLDNALKKAVTEKKAFLAESLLKSGATLTLQDQENLNNDLKKAISSKNALSAEMLTKCGAQLSTEERIDLQFN